MVDEFSPEEHEAEGLVGLVLANLFKEATRARLSVIRGLNLRSQRPEYLPERVACPDEQLAKSITPEAIVIETLFDVLEHLGLSPGDQFA